MGACHSDSDAGVPTSTFAEKSQRRFGRLSVASDSDLPKRIAQDGRLLADFALFLHEGRRTEELLDLWSLDLAAAVDWNAEEEASCLSMRERSSQVFEGCCRLLEGLEQAWEDYQKSPEGLGNFDDTREWEPHDFPDEAVLEEIKKGDDPRRVSQDHANYEFSIAAMVGVHVSVVCSDLITSWVLAASGGLENLTAVFQRRFPMLSLDDCSREHVRIFPVPASGSAYSPQTCLDSTFHIEEFAPRLFAQVRRMSGISSAEYFDSVCRTDFEFIAFGTNSKSGEIFFFSHDHQYLVKTTTDLEAKMLIKMLPKYLQRLKEEPRSFLGRYCGLYRVSMEGEPSRLFFVMRSVTTHSLGISHTYDIKGSLRHRFADPDESVGKDLNFDQELGPSLGLPAAVAREVAEVHQTDVELLQEFRIMDFSLLLQIHDTQGTFQEQRQQCSVQLTRKRPRRLSLAALSWKKRSPKHAKAAGFQAAPREVKVRAGSHPGWTRQGTGMAPQMSMSNWSASDGSLKGRDGSLLYSMGLIDMLVPFSAYPKMQYVGMEVITCGRGTESSRVPPDFYCERQIEKVHKMCDLESPFED